MWSSLRGCPQHRISFWKNLQTFLKLKPFIIQNFEKNYLIQIIKFFEQATYKGCFFRYLRKHKLNDKLNSDEIDYCNLAFVTKKNIFLNQTFDKVIFDLTIFPSLVWFLAHLR